MTTYAITGASGHLGRLVVQELLARGVPASDVVALARTPEKAADLVLGNTPLAPDETPYYRHRSGSPLRCR